MAGRFITFEGGEGTGKSTQSRRLAAKLAERGIEVVHTREPGGTPGAESVRALLVNGPADRWNANAEALLMSAARADHVAKVIAPALGQGKWVVCDRFTDSTDTYQGHAGGMDPEMLDALHLAATGGLAPDLTIVLDIEVELGLGRAGKRAASAGAAGAEDRFEGKGSEYHETVRRGFLAQAERYPSRCVVVDASGTLDEVEAAILAAVESRFPTWRGVPR